MQYNMLFNFAVIAKNGFSLYFVEIIKRIRGCTVFCKFHPARKKCTLQKISRTSECKDWSILFRPYIQICVDWNLGIIYITALKARHTVPIIFAVQYLKAFMSGKAYSIIGCHSYHKPDVNRTKMAVMLTFYKPRSHIW